MKETILKYLIKWHWVRLQCRAATVSITPGSNPEPRRQSLPSCPPRPQRTRVCLLSMWTDPLRTLHISGAVQQGTLASPPRAGRFPVPVIAHKSALRSFSRPLAAPLGGGPPFPQHRLMDVGLVSHPIVPSLSLCPLTRHLSSAGTGRVS